MGKIQANLLYRLEYYGPASLYLPTLMYTLSSKGVQEAYNIGLPLPKFETNCDKVGILNNLFKFNTMCSTSRSHA